MKAEQIEMLAYTFFNLLSLYTLDCMISIFLNKKTNNNKIVEIIPYIIFITFGIGTYYFNTVPLLNVLTSIMLVMIVTINYEGDIKSKFALSLFWTLFLLILEVCISTFCTKLLDIELNDMLNNTILYLIINSLIVITALVIIKIIKLLYTKNMKDEKISNIDSIQVAIIPFCSIMIIYVLMQIVLKYKATSWSIITAIILIVFINIFFFYLFEKIKYIEELKFDNALLKNQSEYYLKLEESINSSVNKIRTMKHDLKHQILYIKAKVSDSEEDNKAEINNELDLLIGESLSDDITLYTKNSKINHLINYKLFDIWNKGIETEVKINICEDTIIDEKKMYIILGNSIDNAIENYNNEKSYNSKIVIILAEDNGNLFFKISNPYNNDLVFKNGLPITNKKNKDMHGIGLRSIKKLVEDKNGHFEIKTNNNIFSLEILLFDEVKKL